MISDSSRNGPAWSELETISLLKGILKHGENSWTNILSDEKFEKSRNSNQIALKWQMIKIYMKGELDSINVKRQKLITEDTWMVAVIKKLQKQNNLKVDAPIEIAKSHISPYFRRISQKLAEDAARKPSIDEDKEGNKPGPTTGGQESGAIFKIEKQIPLGKPLFLSPIPLPLNMLNLDYLPVL